MHTTSITSLILITSLFCLVGCATAPKSGQTQSDGQALHVDNQYRVLKQGDSRVSEVDYYTIAGREDLAQEIQKKQKRAALIKNTGLVVALAGTAAIAASVLLSADEGDPDAVLTASQSSAMLYGGIGAAMLGGVAWYMTDNKPLQEGYIMHGFETATQVGDTYNTTMGVEPPKPPEPKKPTYTASSSATSTTSVAKAEPVEAKPVEITIDVPKDAESLKDFLVEKGWNMRAGVDLPEGMKVDQMLSGINFFIQRDQNASISINVVQDLPVTLNGEVIDKVVERHNMIYMISFDWKTTDEGTISISGVTASDMGADLTFLYMPNPNDAWSSEPYDQDTFLGKYGAELSDNDKKAFREALKARQKDFTRAIKKSEGLKRFSASKKNTLSIRMLQGRKAEWLNDKDEVLFVGERSEY